MYVDKELEFSNDQAVTASAASTNYVDMGVARDIGMSDAVIAVTVTEAATAAGSATVTFAIQTDDDAAFGSATTVRQTDAIGKATLTAGYQFFLKVPHGIDERYLRLYYTVATGPLTAGQFTAHIVEGVQSSKAYADAL
jgi:hypothetical protein